MTSFQVNLDIKRKIISLYIDVVFIVNFCIYGGSSLPSFSFCHTPDPLSTLPLDERLTESSLD
jgi:hypothetical protein